MSLKRIVIIYILCPADNLYLGLILYGFDREIIGDGRSIAVIMEYVHLHHLQ
jgi:hypothetical protein